MRENPARTLRETPSREPCARTLRENPARDPCARPLRENPARNHAREPSAITIRENHPRDPIKYPTLRPHWIIWSGCILLPYMVTKRIHYPQAILDPPKWLIEISTKFGLPKKMKVLYKKPPRYHLTDNQNSILVIILECILSNKLVRYLMLLFNVPFCWDKFFFEIKVIQFFENGHF
jgi:hypothetical protein